MEPIATRNVALFVQFLTPKDAENAELFTQRPFNGPSGLCALSG